MIHSQTIQSPSVFETIRQRRSNGLMKQDLPSKEQIERLLEAAIYAPNHHITEPWRFFVITGSAREKLGEVMAKALEGHLTGEKPARDLEILQKERMKPLRAPAIIAVSVSAVERKEDFWERIEAGSAAVQNMLLTAQEMGLATIWRTGSAAYDPLVKQWFGLTPEDHIVAFVYVGFASTQRPARVPASFVPKTTWLSE
jgi:nitroreductase